MSEMVRWIAAEGSRFRNDISSPKGTQRDTGKCIHENQGPHVRDLVAHNFASQVVAKNATEAGQVIAEQDQRSRVSQKRRDPGHPQIKSWEYERERRIYRGRTVAMLRRYMRYSMETGRLPSLVGKEFFRSNVTKYRVTTFEDRVIFVHDMERCLGRLDEFAREVLARVVLQEYEHEEAARMFGCTRMTVHRKLLEALDALSEILLEVELLDSLSSIERNVVKRDPSTILG